MISKILKDLPAGYSVPSRSSRPPGRPPSRPLAPHRSSWVCASASIRTARDSWSRCPIRSRCGPSPCPNPNRVVIDMPVVQWHLEAPPRPTGNGVVRSYRYGLFRSGNSRFVIDLNSPVSVSNALVIPPTGGYGYRVGHRPVSHHAGQVRSSSGLAGGSSGARGRRRTAGVAAAGAAADARDGRKERHRHRCGPWRNRLRYQRSQWLDGERSRTG